MLLRSFAATLIVTTCVSCERARSATVEFYIENGYRFAQAERETIETIVDAVVPEVRRLLPTVPADIVVKVYPGTDVIPETGETGFTAGTNRVFWIVNPQRAEGVSAIAARELRGTLFHELHHLVRAQTESSITLKARVVGEGLATVFERDMAGMPAPWGKYPPEVVEWTREILELPDDAPWKQWMSRHPDGRRWVGYKVGAYIADRAMRSSKRSAAELVHTPTQEVLRLAGF